MHSLPLFVRLEGVPVILLGKGDAASAKRTILNRAGAQIVGEEADARLAIVAIDDEDEAIAAVERLRARRILINAVDRPDLCDFTLPAIIDRDPVLIAIGTGGASAGLAKALRQRLEAILPANLGAVANALSAAKLAIRGRWPDPALRRSAIDSALAPGGPLDPLASHPPDAVQSWLASGAAEVARGNYRFEVTSDDPDQLTLEMARLLGQADLIIHDPEISSAVLARGRADAVRCTLDQAPHPLPDGLVIRLVRGLRT